MAYRFSPTDSWTPWKFAIKSIYPLCFFFSNCLSG